MTARLLATLPDAAAHVGAAPVCRAEIVVIVNPKNPASRRFAEQMARFFLGKSTLFRPVEDGEGSAVRDEFHGKVLLKDSSQLKAIWSRLVFFTGKGTAPRVYGSAAEVK